MKQDKISLFKEGMRKKENSGISPEETSSDFREAALEHLDALFGFAMILTQNSRPGVRDCDASFYRLLVFQTPACNAHPL
ncbi:MAG: hypothetical protein ACREA2_00455 [Blastocatellia bacterium]